jgi:hypothetical protein
LLVRLYSRGLLTRKVPMKGFKVVIYISFPLPKLTWRNRRNLVQEVNRETRIGLDHLGQLATAKLMAVRHERASAG